MKQEKYLRPEQAILVGVDAKQKSALPLTESMEELAKLTQTAGAKVIGTLTQSRERPDIKHFIGKGKVEELKAMINATNADLVIFDNELSPAQNRNLEDILYCKVIDRTELILDIFAQHARSREGKLQVELAQASFLLTRLYGFGVQMSRQGGGIATRGPGETKLEYDRRNINKRISELKNEIEKIRKERGLRRDKRKHAQMPVIALVGYTNSGKSTLLNSLTHATALTQDMLFATLDPTTKRIFLPDQRTALITDTVGFIQKLPHQLIAAFSATMEEVTQADLLLHVVDISNPHFEHQIEAVLNVLEELNAKDLPLITVFNKIDKITITAKEELLKKYEPAIFISAQNKTGLEELLKLSTHSLSHSA